MVSFFVERPMMLAVPVLLLFGLSILPLRWALARRLNPLFDARLRSNVWWVHVEPSFFPSFVRAATYARLVLNRGALVPRIPEVMNYDFRSGLDEKTVRLCRWFRASELGALGACVWFLLFAVADLAAFPGAQGVALAYFMAFVGLGIALRRPLLRFLDPGLGGQFPHHRGYESEPAAQSERFRLYATWILFPRFFARKHPTALRFDYAAAVPFPLRVAARVYASLFLGLLVLLAVLVTHQVFFRSSTQL